MEYTSYALFRFVTSSAFLIICCFTAGAQAPVIQWEKSLGGSSGDNAQSICSIADGGYVIAGYSSSTNGDVTGLHGTQLDFWVVNISLSGVIQWQKTLGGTGADLGVAIVATMDNGYAVAGYSSSNDGDVSGNHGNTDYWVTKLNNTGGLQWQQSLGGSLTDIAVAIQQTSDTGYIVAGRSFSTDGDITGHHDSVDGWLVKLSSSGNIQWQVSLGGSMADGAYDVQQTADSGFIVVCNTNSTDGDVTGNHGDYDAWVVKLSPAGAIQWQKCLGGSGTDFANNIRQTPDGGYIVAGSSKSADGDVTGNHGDFDYWIVKLTPTGSIVWQKSLGGSAAEFSYSIRQTYDSGYIVAGNTFSGDMDIAGNYGQWDIWLTKLSATGGLQWQKSLGGSNYDGTNSILQTAEGGYILAGSSSSGDFCVTENHGSSDYWIVKLRDPVMTPTGTEGINKAAANMVTLNPNPASDVINIVSPVDISSIKITDITGRVQYEQDQNARQVQLSVAGLSAGMYFVNINGSAVVRFMKE